MVYRSQKGIALYYAIVIMGISLAIALSLSFLTTQSLKTTGEVEKTPPALYAADSGAERAIYELEQDNWKIKPGKGPGKNTHSGSLDDADYTVKLYATSTSPCKNTDAKKYCIYSYGEYKGSKRVIRIIR